MECIRSQDDDHQFGDLGFSQIDDALLMSFLDDSPAEDDDLYCDSEKLSSVMRSLEAEIDQRMIIHSDHHHHQPQQFMAADSNSTTTTAASQKNDDDHGEFMEGFDETSGSGTSTQQDLGCNNLMDMEIQMMNVNGGGGDHGHGGIAGWYQVGDVHDQMDTLRFGSDHVHDMMMDTYNYFDQFNGISFDEAAAPYNGSFWQEPLVN